MTEISYIIKRSRRARHLRITVSGEKTVLTVPLRVSLAQAKHFFHSRRAWVEQALKRSRALKRPWQGTVSEFARHKARAKKLIVERVKHLARAHGFSYRRISIKNHSSKWGSCSKAGNLNFNYRLWFLPPELVDYVVAHELCHLRHLNHSQSFWQEVRSILPEYLAWRRAIKRYHL